LVSHSEGSVCCIPIAPLAGALSIIKDCPGAEAVITAGADKTIQVVEPRSNFIPRCTHDEHRDFICARPCYMSYDI
jgi:hypothetical protein